MQMQDNMMTTTDKQQQQQQQQQAQSSTVSVTEISDQILSNEVERISRISR